MGISVVGIVFIIDTDSREVEEPPFSFGVQLDSINPAEKHKIKIFIFIYIYSLSYSMVVLIIP